MLKKIDPYAFANCTGLENVNILGNNTKQIGDNAFGFTTNLVNIKFETSSTQNPASSSWGQPESKVLYSQELSNLHNKSTKLDKYGSLNVKNGKLVSENNEIVRLKGLSLNGLQWSTRYVTPQTFENIRKNWNVDVIRIPIIPANQASWVSHEDTLKLIDNAVRYATASRLYVILDFHIIGNVEDYTQEATKLFEELAIAYKDYNNVIYEICNEPAGSTVTWSHVKNYASQVVAKIRASDTKNIIICGTPTYSQDIENIASDPLSGNNIMYAVHFYAGTHTVANAKAKMDQAISSNIAIFVSEWSTVASSGMSSVNAEESIKWLEYLKQNDISWIYWNLSNAKDDSGAIIKPEITSTYDWRDSDITDSGKWIINIFKQNTY